MLKLGRLSRISLGCVLLIVSASPSHAQKKLIYDIVYKVILGGIVVLTTTSKTEAQGYKNDNPQATITTVRPSSPASSKEKKASDDDDDEE